jgi:hypothetical protein
MKILELRDRRRFSSDVANVSGVVFAVNRWFVAQTGQAGKT